MSKKVYFISDVHLSFIDSKEEKLKRSKLIDFFKRIENDAESLFILGDLFDFWFEWYHVVPKYFFPILFQIRKLVDKGVEVVLLAGNHDFKLDGYLNSSVGMITYSDCHSFTLNNKKFFLTHGDGWGSGDLGYKIMKKIIRNPASIFLFRTLIPADMGMWIARLISNTSRTVKTRDRSAWLRKYFLKQARAKFKEGFDFVIMGHLHVPARITENGHEFICIGDFITHFTYLEFDGTNLHRRNFDG
jgi:UDP-2,3-diacylglucosamine hydrolase